MTSFPTGYILSAMARTDRTIDNLKATVVRTIGQRLDTVVRSEQAERPQEDRNVAA